MKVKEAKALLDQQDPEAELYTWDDDTDVVSKPYDIKTDTVGNVCIHVLETPVGGTP
jgi:hypothetical protein